MIARIKAYGWQALALGLAGLLLWQTLRLHTAQLDAATTRTTHAEALHKIADLTTKAVQAVRVRETQWALAQEKNARETATQLTAARTDAAAARSAGDRLQQRVAALVTAARGAAAHSGAGPAVASADDPLNLLADMQRRLDGAAGELAEYADAARIAGAGCERDYDALMVP